ncbi:MAG: cyclic nucleotide-binding domain-containing protein [Magnetococcales bacterium]|nr:cyclic nucleotide-binding domain-containing protein [Magnetococcales bacterium]
MSVLFEKLKQTSIQKNNQEISFLRGEEIFGHGESGDSAYVILQGAVELVYQIDRSVSQIYVLKKNDMFGLTGLFGTVARIVTARAKCNTRILKLNRAGLLIYYYRQPEVALALFARTLKRIGSMSGVHIKKEKGKAKTSLKNIGFQYVTLLEKMANSRIPLSGEIVYTQSRERSQKHVSTLVEKGLWQGIFLQNELLQLTELYEQALATGEGKEWAKKALNEWVSFFQPDYLISQSAAKIYLQCAAIQSLEPDEVVAFFLPQQNQHLMEVIIWTNDEPDIASRITAVLAYRGISIHSLFLYPTNHKRILMVLQIQNPIENLGIDNKTLRQIKTLLEGVASSQIRLKDSAISIKPEELCQENFTLDVQVDNSLSNVFTAIRTKVDDLTGVLHVMISSLEMDGLHIHSLVVSTIEGKAENIFFLTNPQGGSLTPAIAKKARNAVVKKLKSFIEGNIFNLKRCNKLS